MQLIGLARLGHRLEVYFLEDRLLQSFLVGVEFHHGQLGLHLPWADKVLRVKIDGTFFDDL